MTNDIITTLDHSQRQLLIRGRDISFPTELQTRHWRVRGDISPLMDRSNPRVVIIGTLDPKPADIAFTRDIVWTLSKQKKRPIVISGLAKGIETIAHKTAIDAGLKTYGVMPVGLDMVYPRQNTLLAEKMLEKGGGFLTWYEDGKLPLAINFIFRTHLMVAMADIVIITSSRKKGTSMVAGRLAKEYGIPCLAVPGLPIDPDHTGCNSLISQGIATILWSLEQLKEM